MGICETKEVPKKHVKKKINQYTPSVLNHPNHNTHSKHQDSIYRELNIAVDMYIQNMNDNIDEYQK